MHIITKRTIQKICQDYRAAEQALMSWYHFVKKERWEKPPDVRQFSNTADFVGDHRFIFNIQGNHYRLIVDVFYAYGNNEGTVLIKWFGTHAEYDRINVRSIE